MRRRRRLSIGESTFVRTIEAARLARAACRVGNCLLAVMSFPGVVAFALTSESPSVTSWTRSHDAARSTNVCSGEVTGSPRRVAGAGTAERRWERIPRVFCLWPVGIERWTSPESGGVPPHRLAAEW